MENPFNAVMSMAKRRGYLWPSFEIYGGSAGFYDYGPLGVRLKENVLAEWRRCFLVGEGFLEIDTPMIAPEIVFEASGHLAEFTDFMVRCEQCKGSFRADHLLEGKVENADALGKEELGSALSEHGVKCPDCSGQVGAPYPFNLMFQTQIGPDSERRGYLRPETAQGIFLDFALLYRQARERLPFGVIQVGRGFRNEISPRQGLIRMREFNMAEAEVFIDPDSTEHSRFSEVADIEVPLVPNTGDTVTSTLGAAIESGMICNGNLAYFMARTYQFLTTVGLDPARLRFRQHLPDEMAHYAGDCWDAEALTGFGWVEIVGIADRSAYDLSAHRDRSGKDLTALRKYDQPVMVTKRVLVPDMRAIGRQFKGDAPRVSAAIKAVELADDDEVPDITVEINGAPTSVQGELFEVKEVTEKVTGERFVPRVVEPSFGVDRIVYTILEHNLRQEVREEQEGGDEDGEAFRVLGLPPRVAPFKFGLFPLVSKPELTTVAQEIDAMLKEHDILANYDESGSIGRRYARMDEVGTPYCITVDFDGLEDRSVTIRERDSRSQRRVPIDDLVDEARTLIK